MADTLTKSKKASGQTPHHLVVADARRYFLNAVANDAPHVLEALRDDVSLPFDVALEDLSQEEQRSLEAFVCTHLGPGKPSEDNGDVPGWALVFAKAAVGRKKALESWQHRFNLCADWIRMAAFDAIAGWIGEPEKLQFGRILRGERTPDFTKSRTLGFISGNPEGPVAFTFQCGGWDPLVETAPEAEGRITKAYRAELREHQEQLRGHHDLDVEFLSERNYRDAIDKLVRFQVLDKEYWDELPPALWEKGRRSLQRSIKRAAELVGLPLRKAQRRPRSY